MEPGEDLAIKRVFGDLQLKALEVDVTPVGLSDPHWPNSSTPLLLVSFLFASSAPLESGWTRWSQSGLGDPVLLTGTQCLCVKCCAN